MWTRDTIPIPIRDGPEGGYPGVEIRLTFLANSDVGGSASGAVLGVFGAVFQGSKFWKELDLEPLRAL